MAHVHAAALEEEEEDREDDAEHVEPRHRFSLHASRSYENLSECEDSYVAHNQIVARSKEGAVFHLFSHQAGGHKPLLRSANGEVCKPAIPLEVKFYTRLEEKYPQLKPYVPPFIGLVTVELNLPSLTPTGGSDRDIKVSSSSSSGDLARMATGRMDATEKKSPMQLLPKVPLPNGHSKKRRLVKHAGASASGYSAKLWKKERNKRKAGISRSNSIGTFKDILSSLWDLTLQYSRPCVLDIKMGTRQHGEDATPAKALSHTAKCEATTSASLGLRICGMQIFNQEDDKYTLWDKHWGRKLTTDDIEPALETYLSNGVSLRHDVLAPLVKKVKELKRTIENTQGLRFWGASLLVIYEGDLRQGQPREDVYLIDFAHCQMSPELDSPDAGLLLGLANIDTFLSNILNK